MKNHFDKIRAFFSLPSNARTVSLVIIIFITLAIPLTVIVSQKQQEVRQRASTSDDGPGGCCVPGEPNDGAGNHCRDNEACDISNGGCTSGFSCRSLTGCGRDSDCGPNNRCQGGTCVSGGNTGQCQSANSLQGRFQLNGSDPWGESKQTATGRAVSLAVFRNGSGELAGSPVNGEYTPTDVSANISGPGMNQVVDVSRINQFTPSQAGTYTLSASCGNNVTARATLTVTGPTATLIPPATNTPAPGAPTASVTGPTTGAVGQPLSFTATAQGNQLTRGEIWVALTSQQNYPYSCPGRKTGEWCNIATTTLSGGTGTINGSWSPTNEGAYYVVVNAYNSAGGQCSGNRFGLPPGWTRCGANDAIFLNITSAPTNTPVPITIFFAELAATNPTPLTNISLSSGNQKTLALWVDTGNISINGFDITVNLGNALQYVTINEASEGSDASKFENEIFKELDQINGKIRFAKVTTDTTKRISGKLHLGSMAFAVKPNVSGSGSLTIGRAEITSSGQAGSLTTIKTPLSYTISNVFTQSTQLAFNLRLQGVGTGPGENRNPRTTTKILNVCLYEPTTDTRNDNNCDKAKYKNLRGNIQFNSSSNNFVNETFALVDGQSLIIQSGLYQVVVKTDKYLRKRIGNVQIQSGSPGTVNAVPQATLIVGDTDGNNLVDARDYNNYLSCIGAKANTPACGDKKFLTDFNDDGKNDTDLNDASYNNSDYKLLFEAFSKQSGD